jgi:hypothetical protein
MEDLAVEVELIQLDQHQLLEVLEILHQYHHHKEILVEQEIMLQGSMLLSVVEEDLVVLGHLVPIPQIMPVDLVA